MYFLPVHDAAGCSKIEDLKKTIEDLVAWMESEDLKSYDPFDLQSTKLVMMLSGILPGKVMQFGLYPLKRFPSLYHPFVARKKAATSSAIYASACWLMGWNGKAEKELDWLESHACTGYSGFCWGLPFDWMMRKDVIAKVGTPYSTIIIYMVDAFLLGYKATGKKKYLDIALSTANFFEKDLKRTFDDGDSVCLSYSPMDDLRVTNVNSYAAANLYTVYNYTKDENIRNLADKLIRFVISEQNENGSWNYFCRLEKRENWIDSLHQCYIMENLYRCYLVNNDKKILDSVEMSFEYFIHNFITEDGLISKYPVNQKFLIGTRYELMDIAESITLFSLLKKKEYAEPALETLAKRFRIPGKPYYYSYLVGGEGTTTPFIRWGEAQALYALAFYQATFFSNKSMRDIIL